MAGAGLSSLSEEQRPHLSTGCLNCTLKEIKVKFNECIPDLLYRISHSIVTIFISQSILPALHKKQLPFWAHDIPLYSFNQSELFLSITFLRKEYGI